jgi:crotonobetainyl-CoA:carnitine CoA-transferase CaiB-like acyl-CoA transferase
MAGDFDSALDGIRVLDITEDRGLYAGKFLADLGADVIKIENPVGSKARETGPFKADVPGLENSLYFIHFNTNKRGITLKLECREGKDIFKRLAKMADVIIEDFEPGKMKRIGLGYRTLKKLNRRVIMSSITGFGQDGPYSQYNSPDIVNFSSGGLTYISGAAEEPPVVAPCEQSYLASSIIAAYGVLSALFLRLRTSEGQLVDVSAHEVVAAFSQGIMRYSVTSGTGGRTGSQFFAAPARIFPCQDGYVHLLVYYPQQWRSFWELLGKPEALSDNAWYEAGFRARNRDLIDPITTEFTMSRTKAEITQICQSRGVPCTPVNTPADIVRDKHFKERGAIIGVGHPVLGEHSYLSPPYRFSATPGSIKRPAPMLGEHNREIYAELGFSDRDLVELGKKGII